MMRSFLSVALWCVVALPIHAQTSKPAFGGEFTFRKLAPPEAGAKKRITIQIEPGADPFPKAPPKPKADPPAAAAGAIGGKTDWFWTTISPQVGQAGTARFIAATEFLAQSDKTSTLKPPRLGGLQRIADAHERTIMAATSGTKLSPAFVLSLIAVESGGRVSATSSKGAQGLMQLIPATAARFGVNDANDAGQNIAGGVKYLDWLIREFDGDPLLALAGYNAGENAVRKYDGVPPFAETRAYVPKVLAAWNIARGLCLTQPLLTSDGCVFRFSQ